MNGMSFAERVKLGSVGEQIILSYLQGDGWVVYKPTQAMPHPFDFLCHRDGNTFIAEVKTKARMKQFRGTGIDYRHYHIYKSFEQKHNIPVYLFFVDYELNLIYGNYLSKLEKPRQQVESNAVIDYPIIMRRSNVIIFPLGEMELIAELSGLEPVELRY